jgi:DNA-binding NarL/FixJ family response regulator
MTRIFLIDGHALRRDGVRIQLAATPGLLLVGEASPGQKLLDQLPTAAADVVMLGAEIAVPESLATMQRLRGEFPQAKVLALVSQNTEQQINRFFEAGAHGCVLPTASGAELQLAVRAVVAGRQFLGSGLGIALLQQILNQQLGPLVFVDAKEPLQLTRRETEILRLLADGLTTGEMAERLFTSKRTVETHRQNILEKTKTKNTAALIKLAMQRGLLG